MNILIEYKKNGATGLRSILNRPSDNQSGLVNDLELLSKDNDVKADIEAQKIIVQRLSDLEAFDEAHKICRKLYMMAPNDPDIQALRHLIRMGTRNPSSTSNQTILEKNKKIFQVISKDVNKQVYGQQTFIDLLSTLVQKSLLNADHSNHYKGVAILSSPKSRGFHTSIETFFKITEQHGIIENGKTTIIDCSRYQAVDNVLASFFIDIYDAFNGQSIVTVFKNVDKCPLDLQVHLNSIVADGTVTLDGRYVYENGSLMKVHDMLVTGSFELIEAKDQYLLFHTYISLEHALQKFKDSSKDKFTYKIALSDIEEIEWLHLFESMLTDVIKKAKTILGVDIYYELDDFHEAILNAFQKAGAGALKMLTNKLYQHISNHLIESNDIHETSLHLTIENDIFIFKDSQRTFPLFPVYESNESLQKIEQQIEQLTGLQDVKQSLDELKIYLAHRENRIAQGLDSSKIPLHFLFTGNPGTGKTTVARLVSEYLKSVGYLKEGHLVEVDRSDLVSQYIGQTAIKTMNIVNTSMGGVLFIDEAYALARGNENDFGKEAIDTLVKAMEDHMGDFVVIFAGYPKEMDDLLDTNPGLHSRITQTFHFNDYTTEELFGIATGIATSNGYLIHEEVQKALLDYFSMHQIKGKTDGGNGRLARQVIENAIKKQAVRVTSQQSSNHNLLQLEDFGLKKKEPFDLEKELSTIIGLNHIKELVITLRNQETINQKRRELNPNFKTEQSLNFIFTGNPGTGKTTIARIVATLFKNINILKKGHLVEVSRADLVAGYVGQTAMKTEKAFMSALGGVLFIDEAYTLSSDQFGKEAVETLMKLMEDYREDIVVILAGYENNMNHFLQINPGLPSRFTNTFNFPDYTANELAQIAQLIFESSEFILDKGALIQLKLFLNGRIHSINGNGRYIRNLCEAIIRIQTNRLSRLGPIDEVDFWKITEIDISHFSKDEYFS